MKFSDFTQILKTTYEITGTALETHARTGDVLSNDKKRRSFDHARAMEFAFMFGQKHETTDSNGKPLRFMDGLRSFIPAANVTIMSNNWGLVTGSGGNLLDAVSVVFDYTSPGGDTRIAFVGNGALNQLNRAIISSAGATGITINWGLREKLWGMNFRELIFPQGRILLKTHPLMSRHTLFTNSMWLLDFSAIKYVPLKGRDTRMLDDIQNKGEDVRRGYWQTEASLMVDYAGQTLGYIGGSGSTLV